MNQCLHTSYYTDSGVGRGGALSPSKEEAGQLVPKETAPSQSPLQGGGGHPESWSFHLLGNLSRASGVELFSTPGVSPESPPSPCIPYQKWAEPVNN